MLVLTGPLLVLVVTMLVAACGSSGEDTNPSDEPIGGGPYPVADLTVRVTNPDTGLDVTYRVSCLGDTATITGDEVEVTPERACETLSVGAAVDRLVNGPAADQICTEQYGGADLAEISGTIDEQAVDTSVDRANGCGIFDWDALLSGLLPPPVGVTG